MMMRKYLKRILTIVLVSVITITTVACEQTGSRHDNGSSPRGNFASGDAVEVKLEEGDTYAVIGVKDFGDIVLVLFPEVAPKAVANFLKLVEDDFYSGITFHRIINDFMIQGGCYIGNGTGAHPDYEQFDTEPSPYAKHLYGAISTANTGQAKSNGQQFFIVNKTEGTDWLDNKHTVFGQTVSGFEVLDLISTFAVAESTNKPLQDVVIERVVTGIYDGSEIPVISTEKEVQEMTGQITIKLFPDIAPIAVDTFKKATEAGYYDGKIFHRIIQNFMIQGGSPNGDGMGSDPRWPEYDTEPSEYAKHLYGAISTANRGLDEDGNGTNGQQFFIVNTQSTDWLDGKHTVFGHMVDGFDTLDALSGLRTKIGDVPVTEVVIESVTINTFEGGDDPTEESLKGNVGGEVKLENGDLYMVMTISYTPTA